MLALHNSYENLNSKLSKDVFDINAIILTIVVQWLSDYQPLEFAIEPNTIFNSETEIINLIEIRVPYES